MDRYLFRGKRYDNKKWAYGSVFYDGIRYYIITDIIDKSHALHGHRSENVELHVVDPATIGQCTGLKDKNGKLIFESDIVKFSKDGETVGVIEYIDDRFVIVVGMWCGDLGHYVKVVNLSIEVIGNIHDNPELLENGATA